MDLVTQVPRMSKEEFESILNSNMQVRLYRHTLYTIHNKASLSQQKTKMI